MKNDELNENMALIGTIIVAATIGIAVASYTNTACGWAAFTVSVKYLPIYGSKC